MAQSDLFDKDARVVKSNQLIKSRMNWTKLEHRVVAMLVAQLERDDEQFREQRVYIKDIADLSGRNGKSLYDQAEDICQKLLDQKIHVRQETPEGKRRYKGYNCMSTCEYVEGAGYIEAKFNDDMRQFLLQLRRRFTQYSLECFVRLSSQHSMRIYELLKMREGLRFLRISVEELRELLSCEHSYERFTDFRRWVLNTAREELMEKADIYFNYKVERNGQTPVRINFVIKPNDEAEEEQGSSEDRRPLIQAADAGHAKDLGVDSRVQSDEKDSRAEKDSPAEPRPKPRFNVYAMVLDEMTQEEMNARSEDDIRTAVQEAMTEVKSRNPDTGEANRAVTAYKRALERLRS